MLELQEQTAAKTGVTADSQAEASIAALRHLRTTRIAIASRIVLDADEIKKMLPEYEGWNAAVVHEESSDIMDVILRYCHDLGLNVVLDATMKSSAGVLRKASEFKSSGFRVEAHYMHLPRQPAAVRAVKRFCEQSNGRYVPVKVILENTSNESNFDSLRPLLNAWSFWDNDVPAGTPPQYVSGQGTYALL